MKARLLSLVVLIVGFFALPSLILRLAGGLESALFLSIVGTSIIGFVAVALFLNLVRDMYGNWKNGRKWYD